MTEKLTRNDLTGLTAEVYDVLAAADAPLGFSLMLRRLNTTPKALNAALLNLYRFDLARMVGGSWQLTGHEGAL